MNAAGRRCSRLSEPSDASALRDDCSRLPILSSGSLGTTDLTPLQDMYADAPAMGLADGADEVHKATVARRVLRGYRPHEGHFPRELLPYKREQAWEKMQPIFAVNPELKEAADRWKAYRETRGRG